MAHLGILIFIVGYFSLFTLVTLYDFFQLYSRRNEREKMGFQFSRYNMFSQKPGSYSFHMSPKAYNLPGNSPQAVQFKVAESGHLDLIEKAEVIIAGGSMAYGIGCTSNEKNACSLLKQKLQKKIINLAVPGYNIAQEVITILKYLDDIQPKTIVLIDGANDLALGLSENYNRVPIDSDPIAFYGEKEYKYIVNENIKLSSLPFLRQGILNALPHFFVLRFHFQILKALKNLFKKKGASNSLSAEVSNNKEKTMQNYLHWLKILADVCKQRQIKLVVALQPYYSYGRQEKDFADFHFKRNHEFDNEMLSMYEAFESKLNELQKTSTFEFVTLYKRVDKFSVNMFTDAVHLNDAGAIEVANLLHPHLG